MSSLLDQPQYSATSWDQWNAFAPSSSSYSVDDDYDDAAEQVGLEDLQSDDEYITFEIASAEDHDDDDDKTTSTYPTAMIISPDGDGESSKAKHDADDDAVNVVDVVVVSDEEEELRREHSCSQEEEEEEEKGQQEDLERQEGEWKIQKDDTISANTLRTLLPAHKLDFITDEDYIPNDVEAQQEEEELPEGVDDKNGRSSGGKAALNQLVFLEDGRKEDALFTVEKKEELDPRTALHEKEQAKFRWKAPQHFIMEPTRSKTLEKERRGNTTTKSDRPGAVATAPRSKFLSKKDDEQERSSSNALENNNKTLFSTTTTGDPSWNQKIQNFQNQKEQESFQKTKTAAPSSLGTPMEPCSSCSKKVTACGPSEDPAAANKQRELLISDILARQEEQKEQGGKPARTIADLGDEKNIKESATFSQATRRTTTTSCVDDGEMKQRCEDENERYREDDLLAIIACIQGDKKHEDILLLIDEENPDVHDQDVHDNNHNDDAVVLDAEVVPLAVKQSLLIEAELVVERQGDSTRSTTGRREEENGIAKVKAATLLDDSQFSKIRKCSLLVLAVVLVIGLALFGILVAVGAVAIQDGGSNNRVVARPDGSFPTPPTTGGSTTTPMSPTQSLAPTISPTKEDLGAYFLALLPEESQEAVLTFLSPQHQAFNLILSSLRQDGFVIPSDITFVDVFALLTFYVTSGARFWIP